MRVSRIGSRALSAFLIVFYLVGVVAISASTHHTNSRNFGYWFRNYGAGNLNEVVINKTFSRSGKLPLEKIEGIYGLGLKGSIELHSKTSLVRVILVDNNLKEHLLYEAYPLIAPGSSFTVENVCEETCVLKSINPRSLKWQIIDASIHIDKLIFFTSFAGKENITKLKRQIKEDQNEAKIEKINNQIERRGLKWHAGKTSISGLFYEEKKELFSKDKVPNLQGAEFYKGGILRVRSGENITFSSGSKSLVSSFDWRNRHGANDPDSPYYDGDTSGSGWLTPVKEQGCNHCWAFAPLHATEAIVNLYFNKHLDLDLSEQDVASCSGGNIGCCEGGYIGTALNHIIDNGVVDESCFPYSASCESCDNKCSDPNEQIKISGKLSPESNEEAIKRAVIDYGPITCGISSWWHFMVLVGFDKDPDTGETIWIFKNSWGEDWGENGYGYLKVELSDLYGKYALLTPVTSLITGYEVGCYDKDGDGYYNWGISENKPATCPANAPSEKDCDDSNPCFGPFDSDGSCVSICQAPAAPSDLNASAVSSDQIDLSWQDNSGNEDGFKIYRDGSQIDTVGANTSSYSDTGLSSNTEYCYQVSAYNSAGESSKSNQDCATTGGSAVFRVTKEGNVYADKAYYGQDFLTGGADIAEHIKVSEPVEPGDVVALDPDNPGQYRKSRKSYSTLASGVISTQPGFTLGVDRSHWSNQIINLTPLFEPQLVLENLSLNDLFVSSNANTFTRLEINLTLEAITQKGISYSQKSSPNLSLPSLRKLLSQEKIEQTLTGDGEPLVALMGVVPVKATTENGPINPGDLLTTSSTSGHVMVCKNKKECAGAIVGKALEPLEEGTGVIKMLIMR